MTSNKEGWLIFYCSSCHTSMASTPATIIFSLTTGSAKIEDKQVRNDHASGLTLSQWEAKDYGHCSLLGSLPVVWLSAYWVISEFAAITAHLFLRSLEALFKRVQSPFCSASFFCPPNIIFRLFYSFFSLACMIHVKEITSHMQLDSLWDWDWTFPGTGTRKSADYNAWDVKKEEWTGAGRVKKACVKANSLLVSFCVISCTVGHCSTHCIYSQAQCHTPLWKRALRNIDSTHPTASTLPSSIHPVPLLSNFIHLI